MIISVQASKRLAILAVGTFAMALASPAAATPFSEINAAAAANAITAHTVRGNISMLDGSGGEITVLSGPDGLFLVDDGIAVSEHKIKSALRAISPGKLRYVVNTHWHWDHTDGNGWVRRCGATIIADRSTLRRLEQTNHIVEWEHTFAPVPMAELPNDIITAERTMHFNGEIIKIHRLRPGHTDGDISVYFVKTDVLSTGDTFWNGIYPFIDYVTGGSIDGAIRAANADLDIAKTDTLIVPGHGQTGNRAQLVAFRDMLVDVRGKVAALKSQGMSIDQVVNAQPTAAYDAKWGQSVINGALFTRLVYRGV